MSQYAKLTTSMWTSTFLSHIFYNFNEYGKKMVRNI